jgi:hypothetical protein
MIAVDRLLSSALGELDPRADLEVEEHVLSCGSCATKYAAFVRLGPAIAQLVRSGSAMMPVTRTLAERLGAEGLISRRYVLEPGKIVPCAVGADDVYTLTTYHADLTGVSRVDLVRTGGRLEDVPFDASEGRFYMVVNCDFLRTLPSMKLPLRLVAVDAGGERTIGEYTLDHTAFVPPA